MPKVIASSAGSNRSHRRGRRTGPTLSEINVIPLVDVMLVLLIIFMVAAPMLQKGIEVNLPVSSRAQHVPESQLYLDIPLSFRKDRRVFLDKQSVPLVTLADRLRQRTTTPGGPQVFIRSDGDLRVQDLISVFDELKAADVQTAGIVTADLPKR
jgi:biopolymer transport protein TolR